MLCYALCNLRIYPQVILSGEKLCLWESQFGCAGKLPTAISFKKSNNFEQHLKKANICAIHCSSVSNQKLCFDRNELFYNSGKCLEYFFSYRMGKTHGCVFNKRFIVTACRQKQLHTNHLR